MHLDRVQLNGFRGIAQLDVRLDPTTVLIGENNVGKTSLLDAIEICLGANSGPQPFSFLPTDFPRRGETTAQLGVQFSFVSDADDDRQESPLVRSACKLDADGRRRLRLEITARLDRASQQIATQWQFLGPAGEALRESPAELLAELRRVHPFLMLRADRYFQASSPVVAAELTDAKVAAGHDERRELERLVETVYRRILQSRGGLEREELLDGFAALGHLMERYSARILDGEAAPRRRFEDLVHRPFRLHARETAPHRLHGGGLRSLALLILLGSFLEARGQQTLSADARPIVAIEEPEAHLHPLLVTSVWSVVDSLRAQKIVTTNSGELLAGVPLPAIRRLVRRGALVDVYRVAPDHLSLEDLRRIGYHIRARRGTALFARCWLLVEGETEFWLLPELARLAGYDLPNEGVACVEFAQCGVEPLVKLANRLGIPWHLLADGDSSGQSYAATAARFLDGAAERERITVLADEDIEHFFWRMGYDHVFQQLAQHAGRVRPRPSAPSPSDRTIDQAIRKWSKPYLALALVEAAAARRSPGVPNELRRVCETTVRLARTQAADLGQHPL